MMENNFGRKKKKMYLSQNIADCDVRGDDFLMETEQCAATRNADKLLFSEVPHMEDR
jgi:hypothetical protein